MASDNYELSTAQKVAQFAFESVVPTPEDNVDAAGMMLDGIRALRRRCALGAKPWQEDQHAPGVPRSYFVYYSEQYDDTSSLAITVDERIVDQPVEPGDEAAMIVLEVQTHEESAHKDITSYIARFGELAVSHSVQYSADTNGLSIEYEDLIAVQEEFPSLTTDIITDLIGTQRYLIGINMPINNDPRISELRKYSSKFRELSDKATEIIKSEELERMFNLKTEGYASKKSIHQLIRFLQLL